MNCPKCKTANLHGANFCEKCGTDLKAAAKEAAQPRSHRGSYSQSQGYRSPYTGYGANVRPTPAPVPRPAPMDAPRPSRSRPGASSGRAAPSAPILPPPNPSPNPSTNPVAGSQPTAPPSRRAARPEKRERSRPSPFLTPPRNVGAPSAESSTVSPPSRPTPQPFGKLESRDGASFELCFDENLIGRASPSEGIVPAVDLASADRSGTVSRRHAKVGRDDQAIYLEDLGSSNGTRLNGQSLRVGLQAPLNDGDEVVFGDLIFTFRSTRPA